MSASLRTFVPDDLPAALNLCRVAGWNQTASDWQRLLSYEPNGCFVVEQQGSLVGTVTTTRYGNELGWIGMMLVDPAYRRRGIATTLLRAAIQYLRDQGVGCIKLDATPAGKLVYQRLGFETEWTYHRWQRDALNRVQNDSGENTGGQLGSVQNTPSDQWYDEQATLDLAAFGVDRGDWIRRLVRDSQLVFSPDGFGMLRPGHLAHYLGPVTAATAESAADLIDRLFAAIEGQIPIFWDIPQPNRDAVKLAEQRGFVAVRDLERMWLGKHMTKAPQLDLQYAISDPGTG